MRFLTLFFAVLLCLFPAGLLRAQHAVDPSQRYFRLIGLVHLTGSGKPGDPIRPEFVPNGAEATREGILAWSLQLTDDKNYPSSGGQSSCFRRDLNDKRPDIQIFEIGKHGKAEIEGALKKVKKDFELDQFQVLAQ